MIGSRSLWGGEEREEERGGRQVCGESCEETENEGQFRVMGQLQVKLSYVPSVLNAAVHTEDRAALLPAEIKNVL